MRDPIHTVFKFSLRHFGIRKADSLMKTAGIFLLCILLLWTGCSRTENSGESGTSEAAAAVPQRVISLSPAMTEMMYALELEPYLIGVTDHCKYPPEAQQKPTVGTIFSPNLEKIASLRPDCVLMTCRQPEKEAQMRSFGWDPLPIHDETLDDVFAGIETLGKRFQVPDRAEKLNDSLKARLRTIQERTRTLPKLRVLLVVSRNYASGQLEDVYAAGHDGLCEPLLDIAGGKNAYEGRSPYPKVSQEGILAMDPDVILEIIPDTAASEQTQESLDRAWQTLPMLSAVRTNRIYRIPESSAALIPGPSLVLWTETTASVLEKAREHTEKEGNVP